MVAKDIAKSPASWGLNVHPSLLKLAKVIDEERTTDSGTAPRAIISRLTIEFPTLEQVRERYQPHFAELHARGDTRASTKERSFYAAVRRDLEALGPDRIAVVEQRFVEI